MHPHNINMQQQQQQQQQGMFPAQLHPLLSFSALGGSSNSTFDPTADLKRQYASKGASQRKQSKHKKPSGKPKRPLSAYNLFFKQEREKLVQAKQKVGFANMAKQISALWKELDEEGRKEFVAAAEIEQKRYRAAVKEWKQISKAEVELAFNSSHSSSSIASNNSSIVGQNDTFAIQRMMIEQKMIEQHLAIRQQIENAMQIHGRRLSMPNVLGSSNGIEMATHQQQIEMQANFGRRLSMPVQTSQIGSSHNLPTTQSSTYDDITPSTYDSSDDSSLDDLTADDLINMPIMDLDQISLEKKGLPSSVVMPLPSRRSSMPSMSTNTRSEWDVNPTPLPPHGGRRLSVPILPEEVKEMEDILAMLDDGDFKFSSPSAA